MALPAPHLDDRRFQDLVDEAKRMVMLRCPEWTDHNVSDPGVTLIETFAHMVDQLLYRVNRVPDRLYVKFLDLLGLRLFPPTPARAPVTFWLSAPATTPLTVNAGAEVGTLRTESDESIVFSLLEDLAIVSCALDAVRTRAAADGTSTDRKQRLDGDSPFPAFADQVAVGDVLLLGLTEAVPHCAVRVEFQGAAEGVGIDPRHPPLVWEAFTGQDWEECSVSLDETGGLNRSGSLVLHIPGGHQASVIDEQRAAWLRARVIDSGGGPFYTSSPVIRGLAACTVGATGECVNAGIVDNEMLGEAEGVPGQVFALGARPVLGGLGAPEVEESSEDGWLPWHAVEDFAASGPQDRHVVVDATAGEVHFGPLVRLADGSTQQHGAIPAKDAAIRIRRYAVGGGAAGNVGAGSVRTLKSSIPFVARVENRQAAHGGVDGETLEEAKRRGPLLLNTRNRAVTAEDFEILAREAAPDVARVRCLTAGVGDVGAGAVKVLVVPAAAAVDGRVDFADLVPDAPLLRRIAAQLDQVRLIGTRVVVEPPFYRGVTAVVSLTAYVGADRERVRRDTTEALYRHLNPLPGGGPDGSGWPFGKAVRAVDMYAVLQAVRGVEFVEEVRLFTANPVTGERGREAARIELEANSLVFSFDHKVRVDQR